MSIDIETKTASLQTFSVTIRALHVNAKQMTLAVFRQLPIFTDDPTGCDHWGVVRYSIKDEGDLWLVLSSQGLLYRMRLVTKRQDIWRHPDHSGAMSDMRKIEWEIARCYDSNGTVPTYYEQKLRAALQDKDEVAAELRRWECEFNHHVQSEKARHERDMALSALPQLFIAV